MYVEITKVSKNMQFSKDVDDKIDYKEGRNRDFVTV